MLVALIALGIQIALGGWTSSNYAAVACPDFPKCQASWIPETDYKDAFVLWRGLGVNYEGGILQHPARVAIHYTHRLGAIVATHCACWSPSSPTLRRKVDSREPSVAAYAVLGRARPAALHRRIDGAGRLPTRTGHGPQRRRGAAAADFVRPLPLAPLPA